MVDRPGLDRACRYRVGVHMGPLITKRELEVGRKDGGPWAEPPFVFLSQAPWMLEVDLA